MKQAWIQMRRFTRGYCVRVGAGVLDLPVHTLAAAVDTARQDERVRTIHLPMVAGGYEKGSEYQPEGHADVLRRCVH